MKLLLDTHVLIWWVKNSKLIPRPVRDRILDSQGTVVVSAASAWEIATKVRIGKLSFPRDFLDSFDDSARTLAFEPLAITPKHAVSGALLPGSHKDPFDRILAGQSVIEGLTLVSADPAFKMLGIDALW